MRRGWIYHADGTITEKGVATSENGGSPAGPYIAGDEGEFVSPIDGKTYSGRSGMREHNKRHGVVNNRDLQGLPYEQVSRDYVPDSRAVKETLIRTMKQKGLL
jgi:hypothetical protein